MNPPPVEIEAQLAEAARQHEEYVDFVRRLERQAIEDPIAYRRRVRRLAFVGYAYILGLLALCLVGVGVIVAVIVTGRAFNGFTAKLLIVIGILIVMILKSLWVKLERPDGVPVSREEAPDLYAVVDSISDALKTPRTDQILITHDVNAAAVQVPRLGIFGWYQNLMILGMPLLMGLSPREATAVIAHEVGHFSGRHGRFGVWIYRLNQTWARLATDDDGNPRKGILFGPFLRWFYPQFSATSFALRRANEYEADRAAASVAGAPALASALTRLTYFPDHLQETFWTPVIDQAKEDPNLSRGLLGRLDEAARRVADRTLIEREVAAAFADVTGYDDTHPSLTDRLQALGIPTNAEVLQGEDPQSAADVFLGAAKPRIVAKLEEDLNQKLGPQWAETYKAHQEEKKSLSRLEALATVRPLTAEERLDLAHATYQVVGKEAGEARLRELLLEFPDDPGALFALGQILLARDDDEGLGMLQTAAGGNPEMGDAVRSLKAAYLARRGEHAKVQELQREAVETAVRREIAERSSDLLMGDEVGPPEFSPAERAKMREELAQVDLLELAYAVTKTLPATSETRTYLVVFFKRKLVEATDHSERLVASVHAKLTHPRPIYVVIDQPRGPWVRKLQDMPEALIFDRKA